MKTMTMLAMMLVAVMFATPTMAQEKVLTEEELRFDMGTLSLTEEVLMKSGDSDSTDVKTADATVVATNAPVLSYGTPVQRPNQLKNNTAPFSWGKGFNEVGLTAGGYTGDNGLKGGYFIAEVNHWNEVENAGRNLSLLGIFLMYEPGKVSNGFNWDKKKVLYQPGLYEIFDEQESYHLLLKPRIGVSFDSGSVSETNFTYGAYAELDKLFNPLNRAGLIFDAMIEKRNIGSDGQVNPRLFYEKGLGDEGKTVMLSAGPIWHISPDQTNAGVAGALSYRMPVGTDFAWQVALTGDITKQSTTIGAFVSATWDDIMHVFQSKGR